MVDPLGFWVAREEKGESTSPVVREFRRENLTSNLGALPGKAHYSDPDGDIAFEQSSHARNALVLPTRVAELCLYLAYHGQLSSKR